jgi:hypothetical protein
MSSRLQQARSEAVTRLASTAVRFASSGEGFAFATYVDGNNDGVRSLDIQRGVDGELHAMERLSEWFPGVEFGALPNLPAVDPSGTPPGDDPVRVGPGNLLSFTPLGTATPGSLYIRNRRRSQYVIRVLGETGRTRILKFEPGAGRWRPL